MLPLKSYETNQTKLLQDVLKSARKWQAPGRFSVVQYEVGSGLGAEHRVPVLLPYILQISISAMPRDVKTRYSQLRVLS